MIFIPDISGFTRFVNDTEIQHSQHIIEELLEVLLESNTLNFKVSEIEGDAILFYRIGEPPEPDQLSDQIRQMFINFHSYIQVIERDTVCQCGACRTASRLTLKFFIHFGEIGISKIREHTKLMGKNVILAHRMMKNDVKSDEYLMMTDDFVKLYETSNLREKMNWSEIKEGKISYDHIGEICYYYIELSSFRSQIQPIKPSPDAEKFPDPITFTIQINASMEFVYRIVIDLTQRTNWSEGLKKITYDEKEIPRIGSKHICDLSAGLVELETVQNKRGDKKIEYAERATKSYLLPKATTFFSLEQNGEYTSITMEFHYKKLFLIGWIVDFIFRKNLETNFRKSAQNLKYFCEKELITAQKPQYT
jgi:hypothetical protein